MTKLDKKDLQERLQTLTGWSEREGAIEKQWKFGNNFMEGIAFVHRVAEVAEKLQHHPDISIHWTTVQLRIWTHDEGGITEKDFELARAIEEHAVKG